MSCNKKIFGHFLEAISNRLSINTILNILYLWKNNHNIENIIGNTFDADFKANEEYFSKNTLDYYPQIFINGHKIVGFIDFENIKVGLNSIYD